MPPREHLHPRGQANFAQDITAYYARFGLPEFYAVALFHELPADSFYVGGKPTAASVRITIDHLARQLDDPEMRKRMTRGLDTLMAPTRTTGGRPVSTSELDGQRIRSPTLPRGFAFSTGWLMTRSATQWV